jgi:TetR/AcrR family acrAB operon transcriptional repressor
VTTVGAQGDGRRTYEVGVESRRRILDAAEQLIAERGFEKTSILEISKRSGVSRGSIPWHFTNKDGILLAIIDRVTSRFFGEELLADGDAGVDTHNVLARFADLTRSDGARLLFAALNQAVAATGPVRDQYQEFYAGERAKISAWLEYEGVPARERKPLAAAVLSGLLGATLQWLVDPNDVDLEATINALADMITDHLPKA